MQRSHNDTEFEKRRFPISLICDNINKAPNIGSLFRTADAFGVEKVIFCGKHIPLGRRMTKTSRATEKVVIHEVRDDIINVISEFKSQGYCIVALEITSDSVPIHEHQFTSQPIALIIGDENHGISSQVLEHSDLIIHLNMFGLNSSMNVVQACAIALYEMTRQLSR